MKDRGRDEVLARMSASGPRRVIGIGMMAVLAFFVLYVAVTTPPTLGWQLFLVAMGALALMAAQSMWKSTARTLVLTRTELRDDSGTVIARVEDIVSIDRGAFAFKPSSGFLLRLSQPYPRAWRPGIWWRARTRVGVGGMTPRNEGKYMSEVIALLLAEREAR